MAAAWLMRRRAGVLALALALDLALGEPPNALHPVAGLGRLIASLEGRAPHTGRGRQLVWGATVAAGVPLVAALAGAAIERATRRLGAGGLLGEAALLKTAFAVRALLQAGGAVQTALEARDQEEARAALRSLVSRDTAALPPALLAAAAIESLAENATDSFIAPWLAYAVAGLPGAFAYRAVNTLDSMIGYRARYEYLGKASARLDDLACLLPARLAALALCLAAPAGGGSVRGALRGMLRDHGRTASPNAGWTMAAMAGALGVRLEKRDAYILGDGREPSAGDIARAARIIGALAGLGAAAATGGLLTASHLRARRAEKEISSTG